MANHFDWEKYRYSPSLVAAALFIFLFALMTAVYRYQMMRIKKPFMIWIIVGAAFEVIGSSARIASHYNTAAWTPFIIQSLFTLLPPLFFAATIYMMLGRTIRLAQGEAHCAIAPKRLTRTFVVFDIVVLHVQGAGGALMRTMKLDLAITGSNVIIAGLGLQVVTCRLFILIAANFHINMVQFKPKTTSHSHTAIDSQLNPRLRNPNSNATFDKGKWKIAIRDLHILSLLILVRCIFRVVEYAMGNAAFLNAHEVFLYVFDATLMVAVLGFMAVLQPARWLPKKNEKIGDQEMEMEMK